MASPVNFAKWRIKKEWLWLILAAIIGAAISHYTSKFLDKADEAITS